MTAHNEGRGTKNWNKETTLVHENALCKFGILEKNNMLKYVEQIF
jgi:hypothetical protein